MTGFILNLNASLADFVVASTLSIFITYILEIYEKSDNGRLNMMWFFSLTIIIINKLYVLRLIPLALCFGLLCLIPHDYIHIKNFVYTNLTLVTFYKIITGSS